MSVPPLIAVKAAQSAQGGLQKALTGDIYTKTWFETVGKGKKAKLVEKTVHVNPVGIGLGMLAIGAAATAAVGALWLAQLKLTPVHHRTYTTVVDTPEVPAQYQWVTVNDEWIEPVEVQGAYLGARCTLDGAENTVANPVPNSAAWYSYHTPHGLEKLYGTRTLAGYWKTHKEYQETAAAIPAVTHQEPTGKSTLRFAIEQRQPFSIADVLPNPVNAFKEATGLDKPVFGEWAKGQIFARKWW